MKAQSVLGMCMILLFALPAFAQFAEETVSPPVVPAGDEVELTLVLFDGDEVVRNIHARLSLVDEQGNEQHTLKYVREDGTVTVLLVPGLWEVNIVVDDLETPGKDYVFSSELRVFSARGEPVHVIPAGSVQGTVYRNNRAVPDAEVVLYCGGNAVPVSVFADNSGSFSADVPVGECRIVAADGDARGESDGKIVQGEVAEVTVELDEDVVVRYPWLLGIGAILLVVLFVAFRKVRQRRVIKHETVSKRVKDIMQTLNEKEHKVVTFLLANQYKSTQATIKNETGIPKTSLLRIFQSLEAKNIVSIEKIGKMKKIALTNWFLGKERFGL